VQTVDLIERLASDDWTAPPTGAVARLAGMLVAGCIASFLVMWAWLGVRPDLAQAVATSAFWMKFAYTLMLAALSFWLVERLGRPGAETARPQRMVLLPLAIIIVLAVTETATSPPAVRMHLLMGASSHVCPWRIVALSLPIFAATVLGLRRLAPTRLILAGAAAGVLAGAAGAWIYAFHCDESAAPFVAVWYTLGIAAVGAIGGASGKWLLRW
jgi:hypothetical protein